MTIMFPVLLIAVGAAVLAFGKRLAVLGAAVGALLGVVLVYLLPGSSDLLLQLIVVILLAVLGFFAVGFAKGIIDIVLLVIGALATAATAAAGRPPAWSDLDEDSTALNYTRTRSSQRVAAPRAPGP